MIASVSMIRAYEDVLHMQNDVFKGATKCDKLSRNPDVCDASSESPE